MIRATLVSLLMIAAACDSADAKTKTDSNDQPTVSAHHQKAVDEALAAVSAVPEVSRSQITSLAVAEATKGRLPAGLHKALEDRAKAPSAQAPMLTMAALAEGDGKAALAKACDADLGEVVGRVSRLPSPSQAAEYYEACKLGTHNLVSPRLAKTAHPSGLLLAHAIYVTLEDKGPLAEGERSLIAALAVPESGVTLTPGARKLVADMNKRVDAGRIPPPPMEWAP